MKPKAAVPRGWQCPEAPGCPAGLGVLPPTAAAPGFIFALLTIGLQTKTQLWDPLYSFLPSHFPKEVEWHGKVHRVLNT